MYSKVQGRPWTSVGLMRRRTRLTNIACVLACLVILVALHQLLLLAYTYNDYILALLPKPHLPQQIRPSRGHERGRTTVGGERDEGNERAPRILCLIITSPAYHVTRARHVAATWSPHCTRAVFLTTAEDPTLPEVLLTPGAATYDQLWEKVTKGFLWAYKVMDEFDWVVKADDDSFVFVENLRAAVKVLNPDSLLAAGVHIADWDTGETYLNGGASYVLSRGAVKVLVERGIQEGKCQRELELGTSEDVNMASCLRLLGVHFLDTRDSEGRQRFHIYPPQELVDPRSEADLRHLWLKRVSVHPYKFGYGELSDEVISFHYVDAETMYLIYYLVYLVNPHANQHHRPLPSSTSPSRPHRERKGWGARVLEA
ncbi:glycoprotein-N-acetylgalactosamine 3-beta-galactosyltransferase 1-like [Portunus trituberculatus]|uniref:glycoprotein-N-acetylgalactosamine 3-beta-galactosyltransferase 1-like n=1 Tax=Portunus trituberculatus TaxID=210409 RepID=UPI001E1CEA2F|nr:glycoprotein-N-acetylgalactosamine 3-beta-galactosyltransferase 1-like [Portunus trituberculatus]XP_045108948.1 glycoprotein-N-acetylgalactosamine 3-beta-galactosyltransferase 1-like [Portunus trituberculatus]XP_045108949.1 glycoprotein-N-acetylgalactosamine 3-beta-galactosyltransferase 1-like [Portunus trituberculatus]XP_045108950.1 glycoprotein-N-acetylgalactosamine 3-beta-galactosyltransferase 1-like [Portunus trituberculatus]XP_045108951.1 glycoprotein-N-acetylgalactosamine 3-beta-galact